MRALLGFCLFVLVTLAAAQSPEATVQKFVDAISRRDLRSAAVLVKGGHIAPDIEAEVTKEKDWPKISLANLSSKTNGDSATVSYQLSVTGVSFKMPPENGSLQLARSAGEWLILPPPIPTGNSRDGMAEMVHIFLLTHADLAQANQAAKATLCLSNIKQIGLACLMFMNDYDDVLKCNTSNFKTKLKPYVRNLDIFTCPLDPKGTTSYSLNSHLAGINQTKVKFPAQTVMAYEGKAGKLNFRHNGRAAVVFADGHAKLISKEAAKDLRWLP